MEFIDTHIHLNASEYSDDLEEVLTQSRAAGVRRWCIPNIDLDTLPKVVALSKQYPLHMFPMIGLHPTHVDADWQLQWTAMEAKRANASWVAVGEVGLDYHWSKEYIEEQKAAFRYSIRIAKAWHIPLVIHTRDAWSNTLAILREEDVTGKVPGVFHCFGGDAIMAREALELGFYLGIGGVLTYPKSGLSEVVKDIPLSKIILETDAPWLSPVPHRGKRNEPKFIGVIAQRLADIKGLSIEEVAEQTSANAEALFKLT